MITNKDTLEDCIDETPNDNSIQKTVLSEPKYVDRSPIVLSFVKFLVKSGAYIRLINVSGTHTHMPDETRNFLDEREDVIHLGRHVTLLETGLIPKELDKMHYPIPYFIAGNNLFKGRIVVPTFRYMGIIFSSRGGNTLGAIREAVYDLEMRTKHVLEKGIPVQAFLSDGRSKDGYIPNMKTTIIQLAIDLNKPLITSSTDCFNINDDYSLINYSGKPYTMTVKDFFTKWAFRNLGEIHITFGKPIIPSDISSDRDVLAKHAREQMMDLIKIYSRNVVALSMMQRREATYSHPVEYYIMNNLEKLAPQSSKFIDFESDDTAEDLIFRAKLADKDPRALPLYGNSIRHYVDGIYDNNFRCK